MTSLAVVDRQWQKVPGWTDGELFPIVIRPGIVCSNTYLIDTERAMIVIDPGSDPAQFELIDQTLAARPGADDKPLLVLLTHCHHDHSHGADRLRVPARAPNLLLAEATGARALREGNRERTLAWLYPDDPAVCRRPAEADLFGDGAAAERLLFAGAHGELRLSASHTPGLGLPPCQKLTVGASDELLIYRTPGHSPCSICIQAGELLFVGDLPFAADPGLIGLDGWNQSDLLRSFDAVERVLEAHGIGVCLTGHGTATAPDLMKRTLRRLRDEARDLKVVDAMDAGRIGVLKEFAGVLLDEAEYLFAVISGRLYAVSHHLEALDESEEARRYVEAADLAKIDRALSGFRDFHEEFHAAGQPTLTLIMKGVQTARQIERVFDAPALSALLDQALTRRTSRLLSDYVALVRGMRLAGLETTPDVGRLLAELVDRLDFNKLDGDGFIESADDAEAYLKGLIARLAFPPAFRKTRVRCVPATTTIGVMMAPDRLGDILVMLLESVAAAGAGEIVVGCDERAGTVSISVSGAVPVEALTPRRVDLARRILEPLGGRLQLVRSAAGGEQLIIELPGLGTPGSQRPDTAAIH